MLFSNIAMHANWYDDYLFFLSKIVFTKYF